MNKGVDHAAEIFLFFSFSNEYYAFNKHPPFEAKFASAKTRRGTIFTTQSWNLEIVAKILFDAIITPLSLSLSLYYRG